MDVLVSTNEAANILGISIQGVHYRIKTKKLKSLKKDNKVYVYIEKNLVANSSYAKSSENNKIESFENDLTSEIIKLKDEQISFLKKSLKWLNKRHNKEIKRLQTSHDKVVDTFKSEISLLQKAYNELHKLYKNTQLQLEQKYKENTEQKKEFLTMKEFISFLAMHGKDSHEIKYIILEKVKAGDKRFMYNSMAKELKILNDSFKDLIA